MNSILKEICKWFLESDIYEKDIGGYRIFYSKREKGPVYPEITAYAISLACDIYKENRDIILIQRAKDCTEYLLKLSKDGLPGHSDNIKYLFDTGIFISALFDLYKVTKIEKYIDEAYIHLEWLCSYFDGEKFPSIVNCVENSKWDNKCWDKLPSVHLAKLAIPLLKGFQEINVKKYKDISNSLLNWAVKLQTNEGRFKINYNNNYTHLHPHCYAIEGFLYAAQYTNKDLYWNTVGKATNWLREVQNEDGSFFQWFPKYPSKGLKEDIIRRIVRVKCSDITSQAIRLWKILGEYENNIKQAEKFLESMNIDSIGLSLIKRKVNFIEMKESKIYSWPTFFYIQSKFIQFGDKSKAIEIF